MHILDIKTTASKVGISPRGIYRAVSDGRFPRPLQLTSHRVGWVEEEIDRWIEARIAARDRVSA